MIAFSTLGSRSRLGNHLFQYAFLRSTARRLGVQFHCPHWIGDDIFDLDDACERVAAPHGIDHRYEEPASCTGFNASALTIADRTDIRGFFQTERYFERTEVLRWYAFKERLVAGAKLRFNGIPLATSTGVSIRLGDFTTTYADRYYVPRSDYYRRALKVIGDTGDVVVFSDDIAGAKALLGDIGRRAYFVDGYEPGEGLYLQSLCRHFVCSASTYSWWGAWLRTAEGGITIAPQEGPMRPGVQVRNDDYWPSSWTRIAALRPLLDSRGAFLVRRQIGQLGHRIRKQLAASFGR